MKRIFAVLSALSLVVATASCSPGLPSEASSVSGTASAPPIVSAPNIDDLVNFPLTRVEACTLDERVTLENYPSIALTEDTLRLGQRIFSSIFTAGEAHAVESHLLYPRSGCSDNEALMALDDGTAQLAFISMSVGKEVFQEQYDYILLGREAPVLLTSNQNPTQAVTSEQAVAIFSSKEPLTWSVYGGGDGALRRLGKFSSGEGMGWQILQKNLLAGVQPAGDFTQESYNQLFAMQDGSILPPEDRQHAAAWSETNDYLLDVMPYSLLLLNASIDAGRLKGIKPIWIDGNAYTPTMFDAGNCPGMVATYAVIPKDLNGDHPARLLASWLQNEPSMEVEKIAAGIGTLALDEASYTHAQDAIFNATE